MAFAAMTLGVMLSWSAPDACPDGRTVRAEVEAMLGRSLDEPFARWVDVHANVRRRGGLFRLEVSGDGSGGPFSRELEDVSCEALAAAAALIVAIAIDPSVFEPVEAEAPLEPTPEEPVSVETAEAVEHIEPAVPAEPAEPTELSPLPFGLPWPRLGLSAFGAFEGGVRPNPAAGLLVGGAIFWRYLRLEALAGYGFERTGVSVIGGGGRACPTLPGAIEASVCGGIELGQLRAHPDGRFLWGAVTLGGGFAWEPVEHLAIRAAGDLVWSVLRPSYQVMGETHRPARFGGRGLLGIEVRFF